MAGAEVAVGGGTSAETSGARAERERAHRGALEEDSWSAGGGGVGGSLDERAASRMAGPDECSEPLLRVSCRLVRLLSTQPGWLCVGPTCLRFLPDAEAPPTPKAQSEEGWIRHGEPEVHETPRQRTLPLAELLEVLPRRYLLRRTALEICLSRGKSYLLTFEDRETRRRVHARILSLRPPRLPAEAYTTRFGKYILESRHQQLVDDWQSWRISNFDYLMRLNTLAGRSYNDLTQYPIMPWVLADWSSEELDLSKGEGTFRDLSKPMGALEPGRAARFRERYTSFADCSGDGMRPFHYGSHYSSAGIVLYFLIRLEPFTTENIRLQGGLFDVADRLFDSLGSTWDSCLSDMSDVKELVPEFFTCPDFLRNAAELPLGVTQQGRALGDVRLPPWASSPEDFIRKHRAALESDHVSAHLHEWIDLIFGCKQRGAAAEEALNVFYYLTYEGAVDLDQLEPALREAVEAQILFFGQTPTQLLARPHPRRHPRAEAGPPPHLFSHVEGVKMYGPLKVGSSRGASFTGAFAPSAFAPSSKLEADPIVHVCVLPLEDRLLTVMRSGRLALHKWFPLKPHGSGVPFTFEAAAPHAAALGFRIDRRCVEGDPVGGAADETRAARCIAVSGDSRWLLSGGHSDGSLRCSSLSRPELVVIAHQHCAPITCLDVGADGVTIVTGSLDMSIIIWSLYGGGGSVAHDTAHEMAAPHPIHVLPGHRAGITCCALSTQLDMLVSAARPPADGGSGGSCFVWDIRKGRCVRRMELRGTAHAVTVSPPIMPLTMPLINPSSSPHQPLINPQATPKQPPSNP